MPKAVVDQIQQDVARAMQMPDVREKLLGMGAEIGGGTADAFRTMFERDYAKMGEVVKSTGIKAQ
jgi:tripartite-type tricarboxylate transporter receptor subunit TctC